jgi:hypothetical protein
MCFIISLATDGFITIYQARLPVLGLIARAFFFGIFMSLFLPPVMKSMGKPLW